MADVRTSVIVDLAGNLDRRSRQFAQSLGRFSTVGRQHLARLQRSTELLGRGVDRLGNRYSALLTGAAGVGALRFVSNLSERMTYLGIQANISADELNKLKQEIFQTANAPDIRVDPKQILSAVEAIVEKTGDLKFARDNLRNIGLAIRATDSEGAAIGEITSEFEKMGLVIRNDVAEALDILTVQGKEGAFTLQNLAALGPRVVTAYTALGRKGIPAIRELGATLQVIRQGTGSAEQAATAFEAVLNTLSNDDKLKLLQKRGIQVFDVDALKQGREVLRPINEIMVEILKAAGGKRSVLSTIFDDEAIKSFNAIGAEFARTGGTASLEKFLNVQADGTTIVKDSARAAREANAALQSLFTTLQGAADRTLAGPIQNVADAVNSLEPERLDAIVDRMIKIGEAVGAAVIGLKAIRLVAGTISTVRGARGGVGGNALTAAAGAAGGMTPVPVIVVGGSLGGGFGGSAATGAAAGGYKSTLAGYGARGSRLSRLVSGGGKLLGRFGGPLALLTSGLLLADTLTDDNKSTTAKIVDSSSIAGSTGGGLAGAAAGAAIGSVVPVIGTALGGIIGGILGAYGGEFLGRKSGEYLTAADIGREVAKSIEGKTDVNIKIDNDGRARLANRFAQGGRRNVTVDTGLMLDTP